MKVSGIVLLILGIIGTLVFGIQALGSSESFSLLGIDIAVSSANWTPVIVSVLILIAGVIMISAGRRKS